MKDAKETKITWITVESSSQPVPKWLSKEFNGHPRVWGKIILRYPIKYLVPAADNQHNPRQDPYSKESRKALTPKLEKYGMTDVLPVTPLKISKNGTVYYEMLSGDKRLIDEKERGVLTMDIRVFEGTEKELDPLRIIYNMKHDISDAETAVYIYTQLYKKHGMTHEEIATQCAVSNKEYSRHWVSHMCTIAANCIPEVIEAWRDDRIKKSHALYIAKNIKLTQRDKQLHTLGLCEKGIKVKKLESMLREYSGKPPKKEPIIERIEKEIPSNKKDKHSTKNVDPEENDTDPDEIPGDKKRKETSAANAVHKIIEERMEDDEEKPKKFAKRYEPRTYYEMIKRYEKRYKHLTEPTKSQRKIIKEYQWLLRQKDVPEEEDAPKDMKKVRK